MYLHSLEIIGFKSFASKTTLNFHRGVTAIVGPNGCGKSNVLDAMRWVLGEQSAKALRGGEMADVIFSGTDSRQPLGLAEVSMTFAECEEQLGVAWNEVRLTRRVHRDGSSQYLLNKAPCRLRDIQQLFMDTGIGRSAYSIMEQGKIDAILSSRPEDRRAIFEEAAGITKFKSQRKEALRKLEHTEGNLIRVTDIIKEVKRQIGSLQRQAGKARRYQSLIADLKTFELHHSHQQFSGLNASQQTALAEIARLTTLQETQAASVEESEVGLTDQRHELEQMEEKLTAARQSVQELKNQIQTAENRIGFNRERGTEFNTLLERYGLDIAAAEEKLNVQQTQIENTDLELEQIDGALQAEQARLDERLNHARGFTQRRAEADQHLQTLSGQINRTEVKLNSLRQQISSIASQREGQETRVGILTDEIAQLTASAERLTGQQTDLQSQVAQHISDQETQNAQVAEAGDQLRAAQEAQRELERTAQQQQRTLSEKESRLDVLRQLNAEGEGFGRGTQAVIKGLDNPDFFKPALGGAIATQLDVADEFIPAVEAALGQNLQAVLLKDTLVAEAAIKTLSGQKLGRASLAVRDLLPTQSAADRFQSVAPASSLSSSPTSEASSQTSAPEGSLGWLTEKVSGEGEIGTLLGHLIGGIVLVKNLETALRLKQAHRDLGFVTLGGEVITREGILQGGHAGKAETSILQRKKQIAALETEAADARRELDQSTAQCDDRAQAVHRAEENLHQTREEAQRLNVALSTLRGQLALIEREAHDASQKNTNLTREKEAIESRQQETGDRLGGLENEQGEATLALADLQGQVEAARLALQQLRGEEEVLVTEANELKVKVATERQRHASLQNQRQPMAARLSELRELIQQRQRDIAGYRDRLAQLATDSEEIRAGIEDTRTLAADAEQEVAALLDQRTALNEAIETADADLRQLRRAASDSQNQRSQHEVKQTHLQLRLENLTQHITRRYQLDLADFQPDHYALIIALREQEKRQSRQAAASSAEDPIAQASSLSSPSDPSAPEPSEGHPIDWSIVETHVRELDQKLESMGPINLDAIQEYDELEERHTFLENQLNDLTTSKQELLDAIAKINLTTKKLFAETFEQVRINFQEMFTELFGGGKANLVLQDESDPLESGIEIIAKPPGKQLTSITLLSGGEKTMTAVALLFSIYMVKPSPFCVLDEMDAPLDESNINRFIKILDRFVSQSQFVVITHNKRTIAKADVLYGVTMEEQGVSKLVGVRFSNRDESHEGKDIIGTNNPSPVPSVAETFGKSGTLHSETAVQAG